MSFPSARGVHYTIKQMLRVIANAKVNRCLGKQYLQQQNKCCIISTIRIDEMQRMPHTKTPEYGRPLGLVIPRCHEAPRCVMQHKIDLLSVAFDYSL
jgi:hypothetical protein